jgi:hypothetical protein
VVARRKCLVINVKEQEPRRIEEYKDRGDGGNVKWGGGGGGGRSWEAGDRRSPRRSPECGIIVIGGVATIDTGTVGVWYGLTIYCVKFGFLVEQT